MFWERREFGEGTEECYRSDKDGGRDISKGIDEKYDGSRMNKVITARINVFHNPEWYFTFFYCLANVCNMYRKWRVIFPVETGKHKKNRCLIILCDFFFFPIGLLFNLKVILKH